MNRNSFFRDINHYLSSISIFVLTLFLILAPSACFAGKWAPRLHKRHACRSAHVRVMTRNLYLGADIMRVMDAAMNNPDDPMAVPMAVAETFEIVQQTNFEERAQKIADEIMFSRPDLIGLQEVSTWLIQEQSDFLQGNPEAADEIVYDFLQILMDALEERGLSYKVAAEVTNADIELPMLAGIDENGMPQLSDLRLVDHDVVLARQFVRVSNTVTGNYTYNISMAIGGVPVEFTRGYIMLDALVRGVTYRFVNTHLEVGGEPGSAFAQVQAAQMQELLMMLAGETEPIIMVGDFNSAPEDPEGQPYSQALQAGFTDAWTVSWHCGSGYTCCFNETLDDYTAPLTVRIDHIFIKPAQLNMRRVVAWNVGSRVWGITPSGMWPSDHAGVVAHIKFKRR